MKTLSSIFASHEETASLDDDMLLLHHLDRIEGGLDDSQRTQLGNTDSGVQSDSDYIPECDLQQHPGSCDSTDNTLMVPITQQADWQSTHTGAEEIRAEVARFDAVLEKILKQKKLAEELAAKQAMTRKQQEEALKNAEVAKTTGVTTTTEVPKITEVAKKAEIPKTATNSSQRYIQAPAQDRGAHTRKPPCTHQVRWTPVAGRSRCQYHSYSPKAYRNSSRYQCPGCKKIACGLCKKQLKRGTYTRKYMK
jgi:hypothetical protein